MKDLLFLGFLCLFTYQLLVFRRFLHRKIDQWLDK